MRGYLMPSRTSFARIRAMLGSVRDAEVAWGLLAQRAAIPRGWLDDPRRRFVHDPDDARGDHVPMRDPALAPTRPSPSTVEHCVLYACDVGGILAAESAAAVVAERLQPWGAPPCGHVVWWTIPRAHYDAAVSDTRPGVSYALAFAFGAIYHALSTERGDLLPDLFGRAEFWAGAWRERATGNVPLPEKVYPPVRGKTFAELPNPFEPLASIEATGYATLRYISAVGTSAGGFLLISPCDVDLFSR